MYINSQQGKFNGLSCLFLLCRILHFGNTYIQHTVLLLEYHESCYRRAKCPFSCSPVFPEFCFTRLPGAPPQPDFPPSVSLALPCSQCLSSLVWFVFKPVLFLHPLLVRLVFVLASPVPVPLVFPVLLIRCGLPPCVTFVFFLWGAILLFTFLDFWTSAH